MKNFDIMKKIISNDKTEFTLNKSKSYDSLIKLDNKSRSYDSLIKLENKSKSYNSLFNLQLNNPLKIYKFNPIKTNHKKKIIKINNSFNNYNILITIFNLNDFVPYFLNEIIIAKDYSESIKNIYRMILKYNILQNKNKILIFLKTFLVIFKLWTLLFSVKIDHIESLLITGFDLLIDNI